MRTGNVKKYVLQLLELNIERMLMNKTEELIDLVSDWTNAEKAAAISLLKTSMVDKDSTRIPTKEVESYVKDTIKQGLVDGKIKDYPEDFDRVSRSLFYREVIQTVVKDIKDELKVDDSSESLKLAWSNCEKAKNLIDFRRAFKMYCTILKSETYSIDDIQEYVDMIDELERENRKLKDYKRIQEELFKILDEKDEEAAIVSKAVSLKGGGLTDSEICKVLGIDRNKLNYARKKVQKQASEC